MARIYYRTKDGRADYGFSIQETSGGDYRVYIDRQPSYGTRPDDAHSTHRHTESSTGRKYVCWNSEIETEADARTIAAAWADNTQEYIRTGRKF